jgi:K+-transporting ATPase KdpF subunit
LASSVSWRCGASRRHATRHRAKGLRAKRLRAEGTAMFDYIISGIVSILLLIYLGWAMFQPEKF